MTHLWALLINANGVQKMNRYLLYFMLTLFLLLFSEFSHAKSDRTNPELVLAHRYIKYLYSNVKVGTSMFFIMCFIIRNSCDRYVSSISFPKSYSCYQAIDCRYSQYLYCSVADTVLERSGSLVEYFFSLPDTRLAPSSFLFSRKRIKQCCGSEIIYFRLRVHLCRLFRLRLQRQPYIAI